MSRDGSITSDFADDTYEFRLSWGELIKLQEARDTGPYLVLNRLLNGGWLVQDISDVIRLGLVGGGMEPVKALKLVRSYVEARVPLENLVLAQRVLGAALIGTTEEELGKKSEAANHPSENSQTESSDLPPSTETA